VALCSPTAACTKTETSAAAPAAVLGQSTAAQQTYRDLERVWQDGSERERQMLDHRLEAFVATYPQDPEARQVLLWRAWLNFLKQKYDEALALADQASSGKEGAVSDAASVLRAAVDTRRGHPDQALRLLEPLSGMIVDSQERDDWAREIIQATLKLKHDDDALKWALVWRLECSEDRRASVQREITRMLDQVSRASLERLWIQLETAERLATTIPGRKQGRSWMRSAVTARLAHFAIYNQDASLAQRLLYDPALSIQKNISLKRLARIAAKAETETQSIGRKIGIILDLDDPQQRRRSSEMVTGILQTLDTLSEKDRALLLTREASRSDPDGYEEAINDLYNEGAAIVIGGFDLASAAELATKARQHAIPVITLSKLAAAQRSEHAFWIDTSDSAAADIWQKTGRGEAKESVEVTDSDPLCNEGAETPFQAWRDQRVEKVYLACGAICAEKLGQTASQMTHLPEIWLGPKAAASAAAWLSEQVRGVITFDSMAREQPNDPALIVWQKRFSRLPHYFEILGHDVTVLIISAMQEIPAVESANAASRSQVMLGVAQQLLRARVRLWSTMSGGFSADHSLVPSYAVRLSESNRSKQNPALGNHDATR
jgi:hypothetical protein